MNSIQSLAEASPSGPSSLVATSSPTSIASPAVPDHVAAPAPASASVPPQSPPPPSISASAQTLAALATQQQQQQQRQQEQQQQQQQHHNPLPHPHSHPHAHQHQHHPHHHLQHTPPHPPPPPLPQVSLGPLPRPDQSPVRQLTPTPAPHAGPAATPPSFFHHPLSPPPPRKDTNSSISTQATSATLASTETNNTSYSADTSPTLHQSIFSLKDGSDISNSRRTSRRRTGPLSQQSRERAALIRKLGACNDCRRRRVACHPSHHNMTWEDVVHKFHRSSSPTVQEIAPTIISGRPLSPVAAHGGIQSLFTHDSQEMDIDSGGPHHHPGRQPLSEARHRTPLPSGPRLEKSLSLPGIESLQNELQTNAARMLTTSSRSRYNSVHALLLFWQDDDDTATVHHAVRELAEVFEGYYRFTLQTKMIPSANDGSKSAWRWLSRELNAFAEERDQRDVLKIVYYAGHTYLDGNREMVLASSKDAQKATTIRWNGIQQILEEACADTLLIMDAAYFPSARMMRQTGVLELVAASTSEEHHGALERCAFTMALAELLRTRASRLNPLSAAEAHSILFSNYPKMVRDKNPEREVVTSFPAPLHTMTSGNSRLPSIFLQPVAHNSPLRGSAHDNYPLLQMSIRLNDDNVNIDSWNEWLRLMPEGVRDVKVEGPFRTTSFR